MLEDFHLIEANVYKIISIFNLKDDSFEHLKPFCKLIECK